MRVARERRCPEGRRSGRGPCCRHRSTRWKDPQVHSSAHSNHAARTARCRCAAASQPSATAASRSPLMPIDRVSSARPRAFAASQQVMRRRANPRAASPRRLERQHAHQAPQLQAGQRRDGREQAGACAGATPPLPLSPSTFTCTQTFSGGRVAALRRKALGDLRAGRCRAPSRSAPRSARVLFACTRPMKCQTGASAAQRLDLRERLMQRSSRRTASARARAPAAGGRPPGPC